MTKPTTTLIAVGTATKDVPYYYKPQDQWVMFSEGKCFLMTTHHNGQHESNRISKRVASMLISNGLHHEG